MGYNDGNQKTILEEETEAVLDFSHLYGSLSPSEALGSHSKLRRTVDIVKHTMAKSARHGGPFC